MPAKPRTKARSRKTAERKPQHAAFVPGRLHIRFKADALRGAACGDGAGRTGAAHDVRERSARAGAACRAADAGDGSAAPAGGAVRRAPDHAVARSRRPAAQGRAGPDLDAQRLRARGVGGERAARGTRRVLHRGARGRARPCRSTCWIASRRLRRSSSSSAWRIAGRRRAGTGRTRRRTCSGDCA